MILCNRATDVAQIGGKAMALLSLQMPNTPPLTVVPVSYFEGQRQEAVLQQELDAWLDPDKCYAVRSSAVDEDSGTASFAGVHQSFLNVKKQDVFAHIDKVYQSAFSPVAMEYRKANGLDTEHIKIAVIIQEMVEADFAGVAFTINPVTNNPDEIVITVTEGLGEKLVDGSVSGSTYLVNAGAVRIQGEDILSKRQLKAVLKLIHQVAQRTDAFQDIEFAVKGNRVYFLQARPIATYCGMDPHQRTLLIDNANIIESYFGVTSPLTFSFAKDVYRDVYTATFRYGKVREKIIASLSPSLSEMLYQHEGKIYYNMRSWYHVTSIFPMKKSTAYMENMMGVKSATEDFHRVRMNLLDMVKLGVVFADKVRRIETLSDQFEENFNRIVKPYYGRQIDGTNQQLRQMFATIEQNVVKEFTVPIVNDCAVMIFFGMLKEKAKKLGISQQELNRYISNQGDVRSVGSATELIGLVDRIKADPAIFRDFDTCSAEELMEKYHRDSPLSQQLQNYIFEFGPRVRDELKLETVTMIEQPVMLYRALKENLHVEKTAARHESAEVPKKLEKLVNKTKKYIKNRERLRLKRTYIYSVVRNIFLAYGRNYCREGRIDDPRDVFYLTKQEVFSGEGDLRKLIAARKAQNRLDCDKPTYNRVVFYGDRALPVHSDRRGSGLCGIPSGNGIVRARACLMNTAADTLPPGDIILTKRTDPGWITLFPRASGLIVEHGSMLSHSFVVAREMGLPAVVGVENATAVIPDGAMVHLDGLKGEIIIEDSVVLQAESVHSLQ